MNIFISTPLACLMAMMLLVTADEVLAVEPTAPHYYEFPPSYDEATTYTLHVRAGEEKSFNMLELAQLVDQGYRTLKIKATEKPAMQYIHSISYGSASRRPHCRLLKQDGYYYRVLLDNEIYQSNLSYDDAMLAIGKLVSIDACIF